MSSNKLDEIVNSAYKYFFNSEKNNVKPILISEILKDTSLIKYDRTSERSKELLNSLFNDNLKLESSSKDKIVFSRINSLNENKCMVTIFMYKNAEEADLINSKNNINAANRFILHANSGKQTFVTIPFQHFDVDEINILPKLEKFPDVKKIIKGNKVISIQITENFFKTDILDDILKNISEDDLITMLFQLIYSLFHYQKKYPDFKLNFNNLDSFLVYVKSKKEKHFNYFVNNLHFIIPDNGIQLRYHDLRNSIIHSDLNNSSLSAKQKKITITEDLINLLTLFKDKLKTTNKKLVSNLIAEIKKNKHNSTNILLNNNLFLKFKQDIPDVTSSEKNTHHHVDSGINVINSPLNVHSTSSIGGNTEDLNNLVTESISEQNINNDDSSSSKNDDSSSSNNVPSIREPTDDTDNDQENDDSSNNVLSIN